MPSDSPPIVDLVVLPDPQISFFPGCIANLREDELAPSRKAALDHAAQTGQKMFWVKQRDASVISPQIKDLYRIGTIARRAESYLRDGSSVVRVVGEDRGELLEMQAEEGLLKGRVQLLPHIPAKDKAAQLSIQSAIDRFEEYSELCDAGGLELPGMWSAAAGFNLEDYSGFADVVAFHAQFRLENRNVEWLDVQHVLEEIDPLARMRLLEQFFQSQAERLKSDPELVRKVREHREEMRREEEERRVQREQKTARLREAVLHQLRNAARPTPEKPGEPGTEVIELPMLPLRDVVVFPGMHVPFIVGRQSSIAAIEQAWTQDRRIFVATQHDGQMDFPSPEQIFKTGVVCTILDRAKLPDENLKILIEGIALGRIIDLNLSEEMNITRVQLTRPAVTAKTGSGIEAALELLSELNISVEQRQSLLDQFDADQNSWLAQCLRVIEESEKAEKD